MDLCERVLLTLNHKEPDRVPYDMGGTVVTGIQAKAYSRLRKYLGLPEKRSSSSTSFSSWRRSTKM